MGLSGDIRKGFRLAAENIRAANEQKQLAEAERDQRLARFRRGYDMFPPEITREYSQRCRAHYIKCFLVNFLFLAGFAALSIWLFMLKTHMTGLVFSCVITLILLIADIINLSKAVRMIIGDFDVFGGIVMNKRVEERTTTDSDGTTSTIYDYYITLNGIESEVSSGDFRRADIETYCFFVRFTAKYIRNDRIIVYPCEQMIDESLITGHHYPKDEIRLYRRPEPNKAAVIFAFLSFVASIFLAAFGRTSAVTGILHDRSLLFAAGSAAVCVICIILNLISVRRREIQQLEEKQRRYDRQ